MGMLSLSCCVLRQTALLGKALLFVRAVRHVPYSIHPGTGMPFD